MTDEIRESFIRQRRNLMVMTLLVTFQDFVGLTYETVNLLGNEADITHPERVKIFVFAMMVYWFIRYMQLMFSLGSLSIVHYFRSFIEYYVMKSRFGTDFQTSAQNVATTQPAKEAGLSYQACHLDFDRETLTVYAEYVDQYSQTDRNSFCKQVPLLVKVRGYLCGAFRLAFRTRLVTEYHLPVLMFVFALFYVILKNRDAITDVVLFVFGV